jgi:hypothetical protein
METPDSQFRHDSEMMAVYELALAHIEGALPGATSNRRVRDTVATALTSLRATGQKDRDILRHYAEYYGLSAAHIGAVR